jgi:hypothetical protein
MAGNVFRKLRMTSSAIATNTQKKQAFHLLKQDDVMPIKADDVMRAPKNAKLLAKPEARYQVTYSA